MRLYLPYKPTGREHFQNLKNFALGLPFSHSPCFGTRLNFKGYGLFQQRHLSQRFATISNSYCGHRLDMVVRHNHVYHRHPHYAQLCNLSTAALQHLHITGGMCTTLEPANTLSHQRYDERTSIVGEIEVDTAVLRIEDHHHTIQEGHAHGCSTCTEHSDKVIRDEQHSHSQSCPPCSSIEDAQHREVNVVGYEEHTRTQVSHDAGCSTCSSVGHPHAHSADGTAARVIAEVKGVESVSEVMEEVSATLSKQQAMVLQAVADKKSVFLTGSAGTGKSYVLRCAIRILKAMNDPWAVYVTASTGLAACALGGTTLHYFAGVGSGTGGKEALLKKVRGSSDKAWRWLMAKVLIIDEISMIDGDLFDKLDYVGREIRMVNEPFGGLQLIISGDFLQLPPVKHELISKSFAFEAECWKDCFDLQVELTHVFRQADKEFVAMLHEIRRGICSTETLKRLRGCTDLSVDLGVSPTRLYPRKVEVLHENVQNLKALQKEVVVFVAHDEGRNAFALTLLRNVLAEKVLSLCIGAQVMLIKNLNTAIGLVNGARGVVVGFFSDQGPVPPEHSPSSYGRVWPIVRFACDGAERVVFAQSWTVMEGETQIAKRTQVPLILAWALTVHKCQGMTLDKVETDLSRAFEYGMVYVALSRVRTLEGLRLLGFNPAKVRAHPKVLSFYEELSCNQDCSHMVCVEG